MPSKRVNGEETPSRTDFPKSEANVMHFIGDLSETIMPIMIFSIPIVAIVGGITMGIVKTMTQSRIIENAQRERIAAIQAGIDPAKLPPLPHGFMDDAEAARNPEESQRRRTNGLLVGGIVTLFTGFGLSAFFTFMDAGDNTWAIGIIPASVGVALLLASFLVGRRGGI